MLLIMQWMWQTLRLLTETSRRWFSCPVRAGTAEELRPSDPVRADVAR